MTVAALELPVVLTFTVPWEPTPMPRPRAALAGGRVRAYMPSHATEAVRRIREHVTDHLPQPWSPLSGPIRLEVTAWLRQPASVPKRARATARPTRRPDVDNYLKTALDGLSPVWQDDAQVVELVASKRYALDTPPRWEITVQPIAKEAS